MKVREARFVTSAVEASGIPRDGVPHVALVGRSNVGKSSLINALAKQPGLARTSAAAGKTRLANLYRVEVEGGPGGPGQSGGAGRWSVYLADLPGYGYARGGRESVAELQGIAEAYFAAGQAGLETGPAADVGRASGPGVDIAAVLHLVDARHPGLRADLEAARWLSSLGIERTTVAAKIDKLTRNERNRNVKALERQLGTAALPVSAVSGEGLDDLWTLIARLSRR